MDPNFVLYQELLAQRPFTTLTRTRIADTIIPQMDAHLGLEIIESLKEQEWLSLSLDGWSDIAKISYYAVMLLKGTELQEFLDTLSLTKKRHTAENLHIALDELFESYEIDWKQICAIVCDSPSVMKKLRRIIGEKYIHIIGLGYAFFL